MPTYARLTTRLRDALVALGLATCGELTSRLAPKLGMSVKPTTILRRLRAVPVSPVETVRILGVDDFAWKKGQAYGTILVDLELHRPIDLLPDRSEETLEAWLRAHPQVELVSRDRAGAYAEAITKGAPQAQQVADRFHLLLNLRDGLRKFLVRKQKWLPEVEEYTADAIPQKARGKWKAIVAPQAFQKMKHEKGFRDMSPTLRKRGSPPTIDAQTYSQASRANRYSRYEAVRALHQQGWSLRDISRRLKMVGKPCVGSSELSPSLNAVGLRIEEACLIPTSPTCSSAGSRGGTMAHNSMRKSKLMATRGLLPCSDASLRTCENNSTLLAIQWHFLWIVLRHHSTVPLNCHHNCHSGVACLPAVPPGSVSASLKSLMRSNATTSNTYARATMIWIRPINSVKLLS